MKTKDFDKLSVSYNDNFAAPMLAKAKAYDNADKKHGKTFAAAMSRDDAAAVLLHVCDCVAAADRVAAKTEKDKNKARLTMLKAENLDVLMSREMRNELGGIRKLIKDAGLDGCDVADVQACIDAVTKGEKAKPITSFRFFANELLKDDKKSATRPAAGQAGATGESEGEGDAPAMDAKPRDKATLFADFLNQWKAAGHGNANQFWEWAGSQEQDKVTDEIQAQQNKADKKAGVLPLQSLAS